MYQTEIDGKHYELGTSGFLYRSNKLMYDHQTQSFWSTLKGEPVVGELVGKGISLNRRFCVTTTWGDWKRQHPETTVLSLDTGYSRNYGEGVAYNAYFNTDKLMFTVPGKDDRLMNKSEVVALRHQKQQLAISADFLLEHPIYEDALGDQKFIILTNAFGANRVYRSDGTKFKSWDGSKTATDTSGRQWQVTEDKLSSGTKSLERMPSHRAFWFGWEAQFPETRLVK